MKKFSINFSELVHYETCTIEAEDADSALDSFLRALEGGMIDVKDVETAHYDVKDENGTEEISMSVSEEQEGE